MSSFNKTDRILLLLQTISQSARKRLSEDHIKALLGNPSKASFYRLVSELTQDRGELGAVLIKNKDEETTYYSLNTKSWLQFAESEKETKFILDCLRHIGPYFSSLSESMGVFDGIDNKKKNLDQRFIYLSKVQGNTLLPHQEKFLKTIVRSILASQKILITYHEKTYEFTPLSLCQHRDDLYLIGTKEGLSPEELRTLKVSRIEELFETKNIFKYPPLSKYNPHELFKNTSGLIRGQEITATIKVFDVSRKIFKEKNFFNSKLIHSSEDSETYDCTYTNIQEFLGQLFIYADSIKVVSPSELQDAFHEKLNKAYSLNLNIKEKKAC